MTRERLLGHCRQRAHSRNDVRSWRSDDGRLDDAAIQPVRRLSRRFRRRQRQDDHHAARCSLGRLALWRRLRMQFLRRELSEWRHLRPNMPLGKPQLFQRRHPRLRFRVFQWRGDAERAFFVRVGTPPSNTALTGTCMACDAQGLLPACPAPANAGWVIGQANLVSEWNFDYSHRARTPLTIIPSATMIPLTRRRATALRAMRRMTPWARTWGLPRTFIKQGPV